MLLRTGDRRAGDAIVYARRDGESGKCKERTRCIGQIRHAAELTSSMAPLVDSKHSVSRGILSRGRPNAEVSDVRLHPLARVG